MATEGLRIDERTRRWIIVHRERIRQVASERVGDELTRLLAAPRAYPALKSMDDTRLLTTILPELEPMRGVDQNQFHHLDVWGHTLAAIDGFERNPIPPILNDHAEILQAYLSETSAQGIPRSAIVKFALLYHDVAKPQTRSVKEDGRVRFIEHEKIGAEIVSKAAKRLTMTRRATELSTLLVREHLATMHLSTQEGVSSRAVGRFLRRTGEHFLGVLIHAWADLEASKGEGRTREQVDRTASVIRAVFEASQRRRTPVESAQKLLTGGDLMRELGVAQGPDIGRLLEEVEDAAIAGEIATREEALALARRLLE